MNEQFQILIGNIVDEAILNGKDIIVNPTNPRMVCGAGVSQVIFKKTGVDILENYTQQKYDISYYHENNLMQVGEIRITPGFNLGIDIMFAQGPRSYDYNSKEEALNALLQTYRNIIDEAVNNNYKNLLCPSLGTGSYCFDHKEIGKIVKETITAYLQEKELNFYLVLYADTDKRYYS